MQSGRFVRKERHQHGAQGGLAHHHRGEQQEPEQGAGSSCSRLEVALQVPGVLQGGRGASADSRLGFSRSLDSSSEG